MTDLSAENTRHELRLTRLYYFTYFGGTGFMSPFINLFFVQQGLSGSQIGWIGSLFAMVLLVAAPYWAARNAHWRFPRRMLQLFLVITGLSYFWLSQQPLFWGIAAFSILRAASSAGIAPLSDSLTLTLTKSARAGFGSVRVWGSFGWVILVPISGWLVDRTGLKTSLWGACLFTALAAALLFGIKPEYFTAKKSQTSGTLSNFRAIAVKIRANRSMAAVAAVIVIIGLANSGVLQFENVFLHQLGAADSVIGLAGMLGAVFELPCMLWADRLIARRGAYTILLLALPLYVGLRVLVLLFPSIAAIMLTRALTGFAFSFYTVALTRFIAQESAPDETRTVLAVYTVTLTNLVTIISAPLAGVAFDRFGAQWLYLIAAVGYGLAWGVLMTGRRHQAERS